MVKTTEEATDRGRAFRIRMNRRGPVGKAMCEPDPPI